MSELLNYIKQQTNPPKNYNETTPSPKTYTDLQQSSLSHFIKTQTAGYKTPAVTQNSNSYSIPKYGTVKFETNMPYSIENQGLYTSPTGGKDKLTAFTEGLGLAGSNIYKNMANANDGIKSVFTPAVQTYREIRPMLNDVNKAGQITDIAKTKQRQYGAGSQFQSDIQQKIIDREDTQNLWTQQVRDNHKDVKYGDKIIDFSYSLGNVLPSVAVGAVTGVPALGKAVMGANVFGGAMGEALSGDATFDQATNYAIADTALEVGMDLLSGGMPFLGNGVISINSLTDKYIENVLARWLANRIFDSVGEGAEESITEFFKPYLKRAIYDPNAPNATTAQLWDAFKAATNVSAVLGLANGMGKIAGKTDFDKSDIFYRAYAQEVDRLADVNIDRNVEIEDNKHYNYNKDDLYESYMRSIQIGELTPLANFELYKDISNQIDNKIVNITTSNGIKITGKSKHSIARVIGTVEYRRSGVSIEAIREALINNKSKIIVKEDPYGQKSIKFCSSDVEVSINPDTGIIIQANPAHSERRKNNEYKK